LGNAKRNRSALNSSWSEQQLFLVIHPSKSFPMHSKIKLLLTFLLAGGSGAAAIAADDGTIAVAPTVSEIVESPKNAADGKRGRGALEQRIQQLDQRLQLTAAQKQQIQEIWTKEAAGAKGTEGKDRRAVMMRSRDEVRAVLTPSQQAKFDAMDREALKGKAGAKAGAKSGAKKVK
jgi:Spy/CpxP family protein refolding chaperone